MLGGGSCGLPGLLRGQDAGHAYGVVHLVTNGHTTGSGRAIDLFVVNIKEKKEIREEKEEEEEWEEEEEEVEKKMMSTIEGMMSGRRG